MDGNSARRGRQQGQTEPTPREIRQCRYCKGKFEVDSKHPNKEFCSDSHRKLHWRYGSLSIGKVAARVERDVRKFVEKEMRPLLAEIARLRARLDALEHGTDIGFGERSASLTDRVGALEREGSARA